MHALIQLQNSNWFRKKKIKTSRIKSKINKKKSKNKKAINYAFLKLEENACSLTACFLIVHLHWFFQCSQEVQSLSVF